jgi:adenylyl-sulfate kinase
LSGAGKSTLAVQLDRELFERGYKTYLLDGDNIRTGVNNGLGFSEEDRIENIRRIAEVAKLFLDAGIVVLAAFISPFQTGRNAVKQVVGYENYIEVFVDTPIEVCERRDVKGLYKKARAGQLKNFTGVDSPYEPPSHPNVKIPTDQMTKEDAIKILISIVEEKIKLK